MNAATTAPKQRACPFGAASRPGVAPGTPGRGTAGRTACTPPASGPARTGSAGGGSLQYLEQAQEGTRLRGSWRPQQPADDPRDPHPCHQQGNQDDEELCHDLHQPSLVFPCRSPTALESGLSWPWLLEAGSAAGQESQLALALEIFSRLPVSAFSTSPSASSSPISLTCRTSLTMKYLAFSYIFFSRNDRLFF